MSSVVNRSKHGLHISSLKSDQLAHFHFSSLHKQALAPGFFKHYWPALVRTKVSSGKDMPQAPKLLINHLQYRESTKRPCLTVYGARRSSAILRDSSASSTQEQPALLVNNSYESSANRGLDSTGSLFARRSAHSSLWMVMSVHDVRKSTFLH